MRNHTKATFKSVTLTETPPYLFRLVKYIAWFFIGSILLSLCLPWQQNVTGTGKVTAYVPSERVQSIDAPINGVVTKWHVQEGTKVKTGDLLLEMQDTDPNFANRLAQQNNQLIEKLNAKQSELNAYALQKESLIVARNAKISASKFKLEVAQQKIRASSEGVSSAQATKETAEMQFKRLSNLLSEGLVSKRDVEVAERDFIIANRSFNSAKVQLQSANAEANSALAELKEIEAQTNAYLQSTQATINKIQGEVADSQNSITSSNSSMARQQLRKVVAPADGVVYRLPINSKSRVISQGEPILTLVPETNKKAVELWVDGRDAPLIYVGREVRLEFEGWPAIQVPGWANVGVGTFGGKVAFVDPTDNGSGQFRIMVLPDNNVSWPSSQFLRQGISAKGWILLDKVTIAYEIWRILNNFPPRIPQELGMPHAISPAAK
jgi:membrane fusion protein, adhesin transport system